MLLLHVLSVSLVLIDSEPHHNFIDVVIGTMTGVLLKRFSENGFAVQSNLL